MMEKKNLVNYNFQSQGQNFQIWANLPKSSIFFHKLAQNYSMKLIECSLEVEFNSIHDGENIF